MARSTLSLLTGALGPGFLTCAALKGLNDAVEHDEEVNPTLTTHHPRSLS